MATALSPVIFVIEACGIQWMVNMGFQFDWKSYSLAGSMSLPLHNHVHLVGCEPLVT